MFDKMYMVRLKRLFLLLFLLLSFFTTKNNLYAKEIDKELEEKIIEGKEILTYELFGAKGDGKTNDYDAIKAAHDFANNVYINTEKVLTVYGGKNKIYYISTMQEPIDIITNVDWKGANFIIDDYVDLNGDYINDVNTYKDVFNVINPISVQTKQNGSKINYLDIKLNIDSDFKILKNTKNLKDIISYVKSNKIYKENKFVQRQMDGSRYWGISVEDENIMFIRKGYNSSVNQNEEIVIDSTTGDVLVDINWNYNKIKNLIVYPLYHDNITIGNGNFISKTKNVSPQEEVKYSKRGIYVNYTGNVTLTNINHILDEEAHADVSDSNTANAYYGFISLRYTCFTNLKNIKLMPRTYVFKSAEGNTIGTYDITLTNSLNVFMDNVSYYCDNVDSEVCYNDAMKSSTRWGVMGNNHLKNLFIKNSKLNRIDSHAGVTNLYVLDSTVGKSGFTLTGKGNFYANNVIVDGSTNLVELRTDYGSTWDGNIIMENIKFIPGQIKKPVLIYSANSQDHYFGYQTFFPNLYLKNINVDLSDNSNFNYLNFIKLYNFSSLSDLSKPNQLYYFKSNIYLKDYNISNNGETYLFDKDFTNYDNNLKILQYGGDNVVNVFLDNDIIVEKKVTSISNAKFKVVNQMDFSFDSISNEVNNFYNTYNKIDNRLFIKEEDDTIIEDNTNDNIIEENDKTDINVTDNSNTGIFFKIITIILLISILLIISKKYYYKLKGF